MLDEIKNAFSKCNEVLSSLSNSKLLAYSLLVFVFHVLLNIISFYGTLIKLPHSHKEKLAALISGLWERIG